MTQCPLTRAPYPQPVMTSERVSRVTPQSNVSPGYPGTMVMTNADGSTAYKSDRSNPSWFSLVYLSHWSTVIGCPNLNLTSALVTQGDSGMIWGDTWDTGHWSHHLMTWCEAEHRRPWGHRGSHSNCSNAGLVGNRDNPANAKYFTISTCDLSPL